MAKFALVRQRRQQGQVAAGVGLVHLGPVFLAEGSPILVGFDRLAQLHGFHAGREVGVPDVIPVPEANSVFGTPRGGLRTVPMRKPSPALRAVPSLTILIAIAISFFGERCL
jgi:hypothetical protein